MLSIHDSTLAWARVYFYTIIGVAIGSLFLASPGKAYLQRKVKERAGGPGGKPGLGRTQSGESLQGTTLGVPSEPGQEFDEMVDEVMEEVKKRRSSKSAQQGPQGAELRKMVEDNLSSKIGISGVGRGEKGQ